MISELLNIFLQTDYNEEYVLADYDVCMRQVDSCCEKFEKSSESFREDFSICNLKKLKLPVSEAKNSTSSSLSVQLTPTKQFTVGTRAITNSPEFWSTSPKTVASTSVSAYYPTFFSTNSGFEIEHVVSDY